MLIRFLINFIKISSFNFGIGFSIIKMKNYNRIKIKENFIIISINILMSLLYSYMYSCIWTNNLHPITNLLCYILYSVIYIYIIRIPFPRGIILCIISITVTFLTKIFAINIMFIAMKLHILNSEILEIISVSIIQLVLLYLFFKIRRFKDGISFLKENLDYKETDTLGWIISILIILSIIILVAIKEYSTKLLMIFIINIGGILMFTWIRKSITKHYKQKMKDRTVELQAEQLQEKDKTIDELREELSDVLKLNHKYNRRISAMEKAVSKLQFNEEFANENADIIELVQNLSKEYKDELAVIEEKRGLPKTEIFSLDNLLEYMNVEMKKDKIIFDLKVNCNVKDIVDNAIKLNRLETLLSDHINDAIIAINHSDSKNRKVKIVFDKVDETYEIKIYDTGIEFEIDTLLKLGIEQVTTHKDSGGSGIGFVTTFETLKECKASLIIEEYKPNDEDYTKCIMIKFDGRNEYKIISYRADEIREQNTRNILILNLQS